MDRENVITHLQIIHTWAEFARERDLQFFTAKHLEDIAQWADDALELLKAQRETIDELISADKALKLLKEQEAKTGTWQWKIHGKAESGGTLGEAICDQCGKSTYATAVKGDLNYCPNCGAKMMDRR